MRLCDTHRFSDDPIYRALALCARVYLGGYEVKYCTVADEEEHYVRFIATREGQICQDALGNIVYGEAWGRVQIRGDCINCAGMGMNGEHVCTVCDGTRLRPKEKA